jgi:ubiquinone/menaquinone biosynthesis C-methylase UbiE
MTPKNPDPLPSGLHFLPEAELKLKNITSPGWILDIGGGGEGVIGQLEGQRVIAVDTSRRELEEAAPGPLKLVMDARELQFLDGSFSAAACFFSLMYIPPGDHGQVLQEIFRVLQPGGKLYLWEANLPPRTDQTLELIAVKLTIHLPDREIKTGYGTRWPEQGLGPEHYQTQMEQAGFRIEDSWKGQGIFHLEAQKP